MVDDATVLGRFRDEHAAVFASLWRRLGEFDLVDVAMADAYLAATASWRESGIPHNPSTWIATVALSVTTGVVSRLGDVEAATPEADLSTLCAACCAAGLTAEQQLVTTLRAVAGLMLPEIADVLGVPEAEARRRLDGAKLALRKLGGRAAGAADPDGRRARIDAVVAAVRAAPGEDAATTADRIAARAAS